MWADLLIHHLLLWAHCWIIIDFNLTSTSSQQRFQSAVWSAHPASHHSACLYGNKVQIGAHFRIFTKLIWLLKIKILHQLKMFPRLWRHNYCTGTRSMWRNGIIKYRVNTGVKRFGSASASLCSDPPLASDLVGKSPEKCKQMIARSNRDRRN